MNALVTGGGGFLGRYIVEQLLARGDRVALLARGDYPGLAAQGVRCHRGSITDPAALLAAVAGVDTVFHVAAKADFWGHPDAFRRVNVEGTAALLEVCRSAGVGKFVYTSTPSVVFAGQDIHGGDESLPYPDWHLGLYPESKRLAEEQVLAANDPDGLLTCALRPHLVYGPRDTHIVPILRDRARSGRLIQIGAGDNLVDVTYVENAATAHLQAADALAPDSPVAGRPYFISDGVPVLMWSWIHALLDGLGVHAAVKKRPYPLAMAAASLMEAAWSAGLPGEPPFTRFMIANFATSHYFSIDAARRDFGYAPQLIGAAALQKTVDWFLAHPEA